MKRVLCLLVAVMMMMGVAFAEDQTREEERYGLTLEYQTSKDYPGSVQIDGLHVYQDGEIYVFTVLFSGGTLATIDVENEERLKTSFFNPPGGEVVKVSWIGDYDRLQYDDKKVEYRIDKAWVDTILAEANHENFITIFMYDKKYNNNDENISVYFRLDQLDDTKIPSVNDLKMGYDIQSQTLTKEMTSEPSGWAKSSIEELLLSNILNEDFFFGYQEGITRADFVYLMVTLYENLTGDKVDVDVNIHFDDTNDLYVRKAATIGITSGIGENLFGPDQIVNREQMANFAMKTLTLAGLTFDQGSSDLFEDDDTISGWAKHNIYLSRANNIISGIGNNAFAPKVEATKEQSMAVMHKLLVKYGDFKWYKAYDKDRIYLKLDGELYQVAMTDDVLYHASEAGQDLYFLNFEDYNTFFNLLMLKADQMTVLPSTNPNFKGQLVLSEVSYLDTAVENIYSGVDKMGEWVRYSLEGTTYKASVKTNKSGAIELMTGFDKILYYDLEGNKSKVDLLRIKPVCEDLGLNFKVTYNKDWKILTIEVLAD